MRPSDGGLKHPDGGLPEIYLFRRTIIGNDCLPYLLPYPLNNMVEPLRKRSLEIEDVSAFRGRVMGGGVEDGLPSILDIIGLPVSRLPQPVADVLHTLPLPVFSAFLEPKLVLF